MENPQKNTCQRAAHQRTEDRNRRAAPVRAALAGTRENGVRDARAQVARRNLYPSEILPNCFLSSKLQVARKKAGAE